LNFFSHVAVVAKFTQDEGIAFGSMFPDFASLLGIKVPTTQNTAILVGYELHHLTDKAFHELSAFREACHEETSKLRRFGFDRGPALAIAHVGLEFLLDCALARDEESVYLFERSLSWASPDCLNAQFCGFSDENTVRFEHLRQRLLTVGPPMDAPKPIVIAERILRTLERRPKLAPPLSMKPQLVDWISTSYSDRTGLFPSLFEQVLEALRPEIRTLLDRTRAPTRFRRA
jgi:hypothetical protein